MNLNGNYTNSWIHGYGSQQSHPQQQHQLFYTTMNHQQQPYGYYQPHVEKTNFGNIIGRSSVGFSNNLQQRNHHTMPASSSSSGYINLREQQRNRYPNNKQQNFRYQHHHQQAHIQQQQQQNHQNMSNNNNGIINGLKNFVNGFINPKLNCNFYTDHHRNYNPKYRNNFVRNDQIDNMQNQQQPEKHSQNISEPHIQTVFFNLTVEPNKITTQLTSATIMTTPTNIKKPTESTSSVDEVDHCHRSTDKSDSFTIFTLDDFPELPVPKQKININLWHNDEKSKESCPFYGFKGKNQKTNNKNKTKQNKEENNQINNNKTALPTIEDDDSSSDIDCFNDNDCNIKNNDSFSSTNTDNVQQERQHKESECDSEDSFIIFTNQSPSNYDKIINIHTNNHNKNAGITPFRPIRTPRERQISECSDDSFIICFTEDAAEGVIEYSDGITSSDDSDDSDTDYDSEDDDDDDNINDKTNSKNQVINKNLNKTENNNINNDILSTTGEHGSQPDSGFDERREKKVHFNLNVEVHTMYVWDFAYRAARKRHWENYVNDRSRFNERIKRLSAILNPILDSKHRENVYKLRFCDINNTTS